MPLPVALKPTAEAHHLLTPDYRCLRSADVFRSQFTCFTDTTFQQPNQHTYNHDTASPRWGSDRATPHPLSLLGPPLCAPRRTCGCCFRCCWEHREHARTPHGRSSHTTTHMCARTTCTCTCSVVWHLRLCPHALTSHGTWPSFIDGIGSLYTCPPHSDSALMSKSNSSIVGTRKA